MHKIFVSQRVYFMPVHVSSTCAHHQEVKMLLTVHLSIFISVINQLDAQNFCFTSLFHACTCFEHMCSSSGGQNVADRAFQYIYLSN